MGKKSSNSVRQQGQKPRERTINGRISRKACSHVRVEVFFTAQVIHHDKEVSYGGHHQVMMKSPPTAPLIMIQSQIVLAALEVLFDGPASPAQAQASPLGR